MLKISTSGLASKAAIAFVWFTLFASASFWVLQMPSQRTLPAFPPQVGQAFIISPAAVARALGGGNGEITAAVQPPLAVRFVLRGIVAGPFGGGAALISVDGQPAQTFQIGGAVGSDLVLRSISAVQVVLGATGGDPAIVRLTMPKIE